MWRKLLRSAIILFVLSDRSNGHTYHSGECPSVEPMSSFDMKQFLGIWYAVQKTSTASSCLVYNVTRGEEPGEYKIEQTSQHFVLGLTPLKHEYSYTGDITIPDKDVPGKMKIKFPLNVAGDSSFTVFMTDYTNYAGVFSCQKLAFAHRQSATLLSRTRSVDKMYVDKMRTRLASHSVDPFDLSIISQADCPKTAADEGYNIHIDSDTFSAANVANVFRKAGEKIGDGVEWTIVTTKKVYHKLTDSDSSDPPKNDKLTQQPQTSNPESEWIRFK